MARQAFPVVLSAPSGTGKTTLAHLLVDSMPDLLISVSFTTRPIRGNEQEGVDYHFVDAAKFQQLIDKNAFLEWANVHGHLYGSSYQSTLDAIEEEKDILFDIDIQGGLQIKKRFENAILIFILPPSLEELQQRLTRRGTDSEEGIAKRMIAAKNEIHLGLHNYDYVINNEKLDRALFDLTAIIRTHRLLRFNREKIHKRLLGY